MKKLPAIFAALLFATESFGSSYLMANASYQNAPISSLNWMTDYQAALSKAALENKSIVLFFTGSDWCTWCHKLENEVLDTQTFANLTQEGFIFVKVDFPRKTKLSPDIKAQNDQLQKKYKIQGYPTLIVIDSKENILANKGYEAGGPEKYAANLNTFRPMKADSFDELKIQFAKAILDGNSDLALSLAERGVAVDQNDYFGVEQYTLLINSGKMYEPYTKQLKERLQRSTRNHYQLAVAEFNLNATQLESGILSPEAAIAPLVKFVDQHGPQDLDTWRVEATVAEVYSNNNNSKEALRWASNALEHAPSDVKQTLEKMIAEIQSDNPGDIALER